MITRASELADCLVLLFRVKRSPRSASNFMVLERSKSPSSLGISSLFFPKKSVHVYSGVMTDAELNSALLSRGGGEASLFVGTTVSLGGRSMIFVHRERKRSIGAFGELALLVQQTQEFGVLLIHKI
mmetsp:Transcript_13274/g.15243  ORF Transcript_13274/g.15243 Transcript_13274/m.15243 type:complete len:127 (-) Transcript_13274:368-748(-)